MDLIVELARPKINLTLGVLGRRADGYHEIASLVAFATGPADRLALAPATDPGSNVAPHSIAGEDAILIDGPFAGAIVGENLLARVMRLARERAREITFGRVTLGKELPVAAGIGGGSADAAALIRALIRANPGYSGSVDWMGIAAKAGADVPVCLASSPAWITGTGTAVTPVAYLPPLEILLVNPLVAVPADKTARVFQALGALPLDREPDLRNPPAIRTAEDLVALIDGGNDLEGAARSVMAAVGAVLSALRALPGCRVAAMSGAGPTCFAVFDDVHTAAEASERLAAAQPGWWVRVATLGS